MKKEKSPRIETNKDQVDNQAAEGLDSTEKIELAITDAKEILGSKFSIGNGISYLRNNRLESLVEKADSKTKQKGLRENLLLDSVNKRKRKIDRLQRKIDGSPDSFFSTYINHQRKQSINNLERRRGYELKYTTKLEVKRENKPEELRKKIDQIIDRKVQAQVRKVERKHAKEASGDSKVATSRLSRSEFLANLTKEQKVAITKEAIAVIREKNIKKDILDEDYPVGIGEETKIRTIGGDYERVDQ